LYHNLLQISIVLSFFAEIVDKINNLKYMNISFQKTIRLQRNDPEGTDFEALLYS